MNIMEIIAPDWMIKAVMIEEFPDFFKMITKQKIVINDVGKLEIDEDFRRMVPNADAICHLIYDKAWRYEFKNWDHLVTLK